MSKSRTARRRPKAASAGSRWSLPLLAGIALAIGLVAVGGWWWSQARASDPAGDVPEAAGPLAARRRRLPHRHQRRRCRRPLTAAYFNPRPIKVSKAEASIVGETLRVFIELRDVNYPGSTYQLTWDPAEDRLKGTYYQAALRESYDVEFGRLKP